MNKAGQEWSALVLEGSGMGKADLFIASEPERRKELEGHSSTFICPECGASCYANRRGICGAHLLDVITKPRSGH